jgi:hypothetical protein
MIPMVRNALICSSAMLAVVIGLPMDSTAQTSANDVERAPHFEITGGMLTGDRVGAAFESKTGALVGGGLVFPVAKRLDLRAQYLYSNQDRRFVAFPGDPPQIPPSIQLHANNLHVVMGTADIALRSWEKGKMYVSPGAGWIRNAARRVGTSPNSSGDAPFGSLGIGYWAEISERLGVRLEVRDYVSGGGTGSIDVFFLEQTWPTPTLAKMPVQNNVAFTVSFTFRLR